MLSRLRGPGPLGLFVIAFSFGAIFWNVPEVIVDASRYDVQAKHLSMYGVDYFVSEWGRELFAWTDMPLMPFLFGLVFKFSGEGRWAIQVFNTLCFAGTVSLTSLIGRELFSVNGGGKHASEKDIGDTAGGLLLAIPYLYTQVPLMLVDIGSMFFLILSVWLFIRAMKYGSWNIPASAIAAVAVMLSKYSLWIMFSIHGLIFLVLLLDTQRRGLKRGLLVLLLVLMIAGPIALYYQDVIDAQIRLLISYQKPGLERWGETFTSSFLFQMHPLIILCALYAVWVAVRKREMKFVIIAWLAVLLVGILQIHRIRYLIPVFPFIALMAAYGLSQVRLVRVRRFLIYSAVLMSLSLAAFGYMKFLNVNNLVNLREAGTYFDTLDADTITVFTYPQRSNINPAIAVPMLDLYTKKGLNYDYVFRTHLTRKQVGTSSFRFTWEYRNPRYYSQHHNGRLEYIAVIAPQKPDADDSRLSGYDLIREFTTAEGFYRFKPFIYVYKEIIDK